MKLGSRLIFILFFLVTSNTFAVQRCDSVSWEASQLHAPTPKKLKEITTHKRNFWRRIKNKINKWLSRGLLFLFIFMLAGAIGLLVRYGRGAVFIIGKYLFIVGILAFGFALVQALINGKRITWTLVLMGVFVWGFLLVVYPDQTALIAEILSIISK